MRRLDGDDGDDAGVDMTGVLERLESDDFGTVGAD